PDLLRDNRDVVEVGEAGEHGAFGRRVDRGRRVAALACADDGLARRPRRQLLEHRTDVGGGVAAEREPVRLRHTGWKSIPESSFGKKKLVFCGITPPAAA